MTGTEHSIPVDGLRRAAGKKTEITRTVTVNTKAPEIRSVTIAPNPADAGETYVITVEVA